MSTEDSLVLSLEDNTIINNHKVTHPMLTLLVLLSGVPVVFLLGLALYGLLES